MRIKRAMCLIVLCLLFAAAVGQAAVLRLGSKGHAVLTLQENLLRLGFFRAAPTGYFGRVTLASVKEFQRSASLKPDGVVGSKTQAAIARALTRLTTQAASRDGNTIALLSWDLVNQIWLPGTTARVYDIDTGITFVAWRLYGSQHADVEPLTKSDTYLMKTIYGGKWSWARRAVIVELNGRYIAGSMNGMPHGQQKIYGNDFDGQFCIHFLGSRLHKNRHLDAEHQAMVLKAARVGLANTIRPAEDAVVEEPPEEQAEREATPQDQLDVE